MPQARCPNGCKAGINYSCPPTCPKCGTIMGEGIKLLEPQPAQKDAMDPHRTALQSIVANLEQVIQFKKDCAWDEIEHGRYQGMEEALDLVRTELARADQLASQPTGDSLIDGLAKLRRMELENIAALESMIAKLDGK